MTEQKTRDMREVIVKDRWSNKKPKVEKVEVLFECNHVKSTEFNKNLETVEFTDFHILVVRFDNSVYGYATLWGNGDGTYHYDGIGHSGACSIITALLQEYLRRTND